MPISVKKAARMADGGSVAITTENIRKASISSQDGLSSERTTRGSAKAMSEKKGTTLEGNLVFKAGKLTFCFLCLFSVA